MASCWLCTRVTPKTKAILIDAGGAGFVRMAYAQSYEKVEQALERIHRFMMRYG